MDPTTDPTNDPTSDPTNDPTTDPTNDPTSDPTIDPTNDPTSDPTNLESKRNDDSALDYILPIVLGSVGVFILILILFWLIKHKVKKQYLNVAETEFDMNLEENLNEDSLL